MKVIIYTVAAAFIAIFAMVSWSIAGKMMTTGGDAGVMKGMAIMAGLVGLSAAGISLGARKIVAVLEGSSADRRSKKDSCG